MRHVSARFISPSFDTVYFLPQCQGRNVKIRFPACCSLSNSGPSSTAEKQRSAAEREASTSATEAAYRQRIGETVDWLGSAKIALQVPAVATEVWLPVQQP